MSVLASNNRIQVFGASGDTTVFDTAEPMPHIIGSAEVWGRLIDIPSPSGQIIPEKQNLLRETQVLATLPQGVNPDFLLVNVRANIVFNAVKIAIAIPHMEWFTVNGSFLVAQEAFPSGAGNDIRLMHVYAEGNQILLDIEAQLFGAATASDPYGFYMEKFKTRAYYDLLIRIGKFTPGG